jgi:hypothetical protein
MEIKDEMTHGGSIAPRWLAGGSIVLLLAVSLWFRISSLEGLPDVDGDETWHAIPLMAMQRGDPATVVTMHGLPLSPFHAALEFPLLLAFGPALWVVRVPTVLTGILAVILTYVLGSRMFDRTTALIASVLLAVLPVTIIYSRTGYESSHAPLYTLLLIYFADQRKIAIVILLLACAYFVHPMTIFILPVLLAVLLARSLAGPSGDLARERRLLLARMAAITSVVLALGLYTLRRPVTHNMSTVFQVGVHGPHAWWHFWALFGRLFLATGRQPRPWHDWSFWVLFLGVLVLGTIRLVRARQWDRMALVVGTALSATALFLVGGSNIIQPGMTRYGLFLVTPTALAFACLAKGLLAAPAEGRRVLVGRLQVAGLLAVAWVLLFSFRMEAVTLNRVVEGSPDPGADSIWSFGSGEKNDCERTLSLIRRDIRRSGAGAIPRVVLADDWGTWSLMRYLATPDKAIEIVWLPDLDTQRNVLDLVTQPDILARARKLMQARSYAVGAKEDIGWMPVAVERVVLSQFPAGSWEQWDVPRRGQIRLSVFRLRDAARPASQAEVAAAAAPPDLKAKARK